MAKSVKPDRDEKRPVEPKEEPPTSVVKEMVPDNRPPTVDECGS